MSALDSLTGALAALAAHLGAESVRYQAARGRAAPAIWIDCATDAAVQRLVLMFGARVTTTSNASGTWLSAQGSTPELGLWIIGPQHAPLSRQEQDIITSAADLRSVVDGQVDEVAVDSRPTTPMPPLSMAEVVASGRAAGGAR